MILNVFRYTYSWYSCCDVFKTNVVYKYNFLCDQCEHFCHAKGQLSGWSTFIPNILLHVWNTLEFIYLGGVPKNNLYFDKTGTLDQNFKTMSKISIWWNIYIFFILIQCAMCVILRIIIPLFQVYCVPKVKVLFCNPVDVTGTSIFCRKGL